MKRKVATFTLAFCISQLAFALEVYETEVTLSSSLGDMFCQNIKHNQHQDWRMPSLPDLLELLDEGFVFETTHCSNTTEVTNITTYKCLSKNGQLIKLLPSQPFEILCVRGETNFSAIPSNEQCPTASFSMSEGVLHIPLVEVPNLVGEVDKYDVRLKMISDDLLFEFLDATKLE